MKNKRIVASLNKVQVPTDRKEAMLNSILAQVDAQAASLDMEQKMNTEYRINQAHGKTQRSREKVKRWPLVLVACLLLAITVVACIPQARAAVSEWVRGWFSVSDYFEQDSESRTMEPTIEAIITNAKDTSVTVTEVGMGHEDYAKAFALSLEEIAYDGDVIYITGTMPGPVARPFVQIYTGGDTFRYAPNDGSLGGDPDWKYYYFECMSTVSLKITDEQEYLGMISPSMTEEMEKICSLETSANAKPVFENDELITTNPITDPLWDEYLSDHDVRFTIELRKVYASMQPLSGMVSGELSVKLFYGNVDSQEPETVLEASLGDITIDANAYKAQTTHVQIGKTVQLGGVHPVIIREWQPDEERTSDDCEVYLYTRELDFMGATVTFKEITFTPTDTKVTLHVQLPAA